MPDAASTKPRILMFARGYQADFFPELRDDAYEAVYVTLTREEAAQVRATGAEVAACFEADYDAITPAEVPEHYLYTSFMAERFLGRYDHDKRIEILGKEIAFWRGLLDRFEPVAVLNELVAIEISEVLLIESRARDIPYLAGMNCVVEDFFYWLPDPMTISGRTFDLPEPGAEAKAEAAAYFEELRQQDYKPFYVKNLAGRRDLRPLAAGVLKTIQWWWRDRRSRTGAFRYESYLEEYSKRIQTFFASFMRPYDRLEEIGEDKEIVFYPLHQEPEATLNYMSEFMANQAASIENILKCLGPHQVLVVKEHPVDKGALLRPKFRTLRDNYSALRYLPAEVPGRAVLKRCERVVTMTSTVGWEAANLGKSVCVMGEIFYDDLPGIKRVASWKELREAMRTPVAKLPRVDPATAEHFVAAMTEASYRGNPFPYPELYSERNIARVKHAIMDGAGLAKGPST
ncbi:hypothetical protein GCM10010923_23300 [Blastomonas marina]|uniref:Capsule polysaccharide biosynthesis protein n=1 Tax=Blastomonas marina TaxID=1867408 RepID=A0ABQ1FG88_9SPHN|nr:hypothetical protein [Blastomonas marina]GGA11959.1 hypothetical protein GCM10010923_23300 [Blastomonas marina]